MIKTDFKKQDLEKHWQLQRDVVDKATVNMRYRDKQIACLLRGMDFEAMVNSGSQGLQIYLYKNWNNPLVEDNLRLFDEWRDTILTEKIDKSMKFGYYPSENELGELELPHQTKASLVKEVKVKREKNEENGLIKGTKKELTANCFHSGKTIQETIAIVLDKFPDAKEKSICLWYKRAKKGEF